MEREKKKKGQTQTVAEWDASCPPLSYSEVFFTSGNGHSTSETRSFSRVINQIPVCFRKITAGRNSATTSSLTVKTVTLLHTDSLLWLSKDCPDKPAPFPRPQQVLYSLLSVVTLCTWMGVTEEKGERPCSFLLCWDLAPPLLPCHGKLWRKPGREKVGLREAEI